MTGWQGRCRRVKPEALWLQLSQASTSSSSANKKLGRRTEVMVMCQRSCVDLAIDSASQDMIAVPTTNGVLPRSSYDECASHPPRQSHVVVLQEQEKCSKQSTYGYLMM